MASRVRWVVFCWQCIVHTAFVFILHCKRARQASVLTAKGYAGLKSKGAGAREAKYIHVHSPTVAPSTQYQYLNHSTGDIYPRQQPLAAIMAPSSPLGGPQKPNRRNPSQHPWQNTISYLGICRLTSHSRSATNLKPAPGDRGVRWRFTANKHCAKHQFSRQRVVLLPTGSCGGTGCSPSGETAKLRLSFGGVRLDVRHFLLVWTLGVVCLLPPFVSLLA
jgi:hypothetical protein